MAIRARARVGGAGTRIGALVALLVVAGAALAALGGPVSAAPGLPTGVPTTLDDGEADLPWEGDELPPAGVAASIGFAAPTPTPTPGYVCSQRSSDAKLKPGEILWIGPRETGAQLVLCFEGFAAHRDIDVEVLAGDESVHRIRLVAGDQGTAASAWTIPPGAPLGDHVVKAVQDTREAIGIIWVTPALRARTLVLPETGPPGTRFRIALLGFPPDARVRLHLYRLTQGDVCGPTFGCWRYLTTLGPVRIDEGGEGGLTLRTQPDDAPNRYLVRTDPAASPGEFALR